MGIAAAMKEITHDILSSYDTRVAEVGRLRKETQGRLGSLRSSREKMTARLEQDLVQGQAEVAAEVRAMREGFQTSHKAMSTELKRDLAQGVATRRSGVKGMLDDCRRALDRANMQLRRELANHYRGIKSEVARMRRETGADLREARIAWCGLTTTLQAKKAGIKGPFQAEVPALEAKLLAAIDQHPRGITLAEVADNLGVAPIVLGRLSRSLLEKGKIRREKKFYFPASAETV